MLSRLHSRTGVQGLLKCVGRIQVPAASTATSSIQKQNESGKRDLVNFPRVKRLEYTPETRFGFVPKSWFDFFYPKTGVTGPYMFLAGVSTYLFSKEIIVVSPEFYLGLSAVTVIAFIQYQFGPKLKEYLLQEVEERSKEIDMQQEHARQSIKDEIENNEKELWQFEGIAKYLPEARRENVYLQMEAAYRARLQDVFTKVKRQMDYHIERQNVERRIAQRNMVDWVVRNVEQSITPQLKKNALKQCIGDLKNLTAKA